VVLSDNLAVLSDTVVIIVLKYETKVIISNILVIQILFSNFKSRVSAVISDSFVILSDIL
jgi:hypothetical protein